MNLGGWLNMPDKRSTTSMLEKRSTNNRRAQPIAITNSACPNRLKVVIRANPNMVVGRNVALIDKRSKRIFGYGKVTNTNTEKAYLDVEAFGAIKDIMIYGIKDIRRGAKIARTKSRDGRGKKRYCLTNKLSHSKAPVETDILKSTEVITID